MLLRRTSSRGAGDTAYRLPKWRRNASYGIGVYWRTFWTAYWVSLEAFVRQFGGWLVCRDFLLFQ